MQLEELTDEQGNAISPQLPDGVKNFLVDIDGTICDDIPNEEPERIPEAKCYPDALEMVNKRYDEGHIITFFTSRTENLRKATEARLRTHSFKYHHMVMGKPRGGNYHRIDNHIVRATRYEGKFTELVTKDHSIEVFAE